MKNITTFDFKDLNQFDKIFCLVSGGIDSTYLLEMIYQECDHSKIYPVNCFNPYETSKTLTQIQHLPQFIEVKPAKEINYGQILKESFLKLPEAYELRRRNKYQKHVFPCCQLIKHKAFLDSELFKEHNTVVISGIKYGDGVQRRLFLHQLRYCKATTKNTNVPDKPTFYYQHKGGQLYCYPFRDFGKKDLPQTTIKTLQNKYPELNHSGCCICPVLVLFQDRIHDPRSKRSIQYWYKLSGQQTFK